MGRLTLCPKWVGKISTNILVTGASGFIGMGFCAHASQMGWRVRGALRGYGALPGGVESLVVGEVSATTNWSQALRNIDVVVHLAARAHVLREDAVDPMAEFRKINTAGALWLARQSAKVGVRRFVYLSSIGVNGNQTWEEPFTELSTPQPHDLYAISKFEAEQGLMQIACESGMEAVIIRPPLVYGPRARGNFASLVHWVCRGVPLPLGWVNNQRSLVALDNLVSFIAGS